MSFFRMKNYFDQKKLNEQLRFIFTLMISLLMILALIIFTVTTIRTSYRKSTAEAEDQVNFMASSYATWLTGIDNLILSMSMESETQEYCMANQANVSEYQTLYTNLSDYLNRYKYVNSDVNFIAVFNETMEQYVYSGKGQGISSIYFEKFYEESIDSAKTAKVRGTLTVDYGYEYSNGKIFTMTFYYPVYSTTVVGKTYGLVCVNMSDSILTEFVSDNMELCLTDSMGSVILSTNNERMKSQEQILDFRSAESGSIVRDGFCYVYKQVSGWNFYVVSVIPLQEFYLSSVRTAIIIIVLTITLLMAGIWIVRWIIDRSYEPMERVVNAMDSATQNHLDARIATEDMGEDFRKLGTGFNQMMDDIQGLMNQVLEEQHQADQIRFNALQSQIQPHFLYNTLDTIHWQARMDGNREMSDLVMALAKYYRICLSKGKDIIPLSTELEQISCYLQIQNKRYGDIIHYEMNVPEELRHVKIPKLTLQPLVENSIYHGIRVKEGFSGTVCIRAGKTESGVVVQVIDCGKGMSREQIAEINRSIQEYDKEFGYGVRNVNRRIQLLFGDKFGLLYRANPSGGVIVDILVPEDYEEDEANLF